MNKYAKIEYVASDIQKDPNKYKLRAGILKRSDLERLSKNVRDEIFRLLRHGAVVVMNIPSEMYYP